MSKWKQFQRTETLAAVLETKNTVESSCAMREKLNAKRSSVIRISPVGMSAVLTRRPGKVRLIEVKGRGRPWDADEVVELSSAQVRKAFEATEHWYLYVVEKIDENSYQVLPIENPARNASKWILCGESWRMVAEDVKVVPGTAD